MSEESSAIVDCEAAFLIRMGCGILERMGEVVVDCVLRFTR